MEETETFAGKPPHFGVLLLVSLGVFCSGIVIDQTVRWSDPVEGLVNGVYHCLLFGLAWCVSALPWSLVIYGLYRWRGWRRYRTHWVLVPAVAMLAMSLGGLITNPPTAAGRFEMWTKVELPEDARNMRTHFSGVGLADYLDYYDFETTPAEVDRLIAEMKLAEDEHYGEWLRDARDTRGMMGPGSWPDVRGWEEPRHYRGWDENEHWFYELTTDRTRTRVRVMVGCI